MGRKWVCFLLVFMLCTEFRGDGARILGIFPSASPSHHIVYQVIMKALAARGHQVTVISTDPLKEPTENYTDVDLSFMYDYVRENYNFTDYQDNTAFGSTLGFSLSMGLLCQMQLGSPQVQDFLTAHPHSNRSFDLVFLELSRFQCYYGLVHHVGSPPVIGIRTVGITGPTLAAVGNPNNPAYFPDYYLPYTSSMTFFERLLNTLYYLWYRFLYHTVQMPVSEAVMRYYFGSDPPSVWEAENNISLVMVNNHWSQSYPLPLMPSIIQLGSIHIQEQPKPLPEDLKDFLDGGTKGVVYFSLGSNVRSETMSEEKKQVFLAAFAELPQRVLWKWEANYTYDLPSNVKMAKWLPQQDVLAHPNVKLFITQGGLQSFHEATYHAVPLIGMPFICDQQHNVRKMVDAGIGVKLDYATITKDELVKTIKKVLHDSSFRKNMRKYSALSKDTPDKPLDRAVWWTEYVLRHNGARHLRSSVMDLTWYQYLLLDVIGFLSLLILVLPYLTYIIIQRIFCCLMNCCSVKHDNISAKYFIHKKFL